MTDTLLETESVAWCALGDLLVQRIRAGADVFVSTEDGVADIDVIGHDGHVDTYSAEVPPNVG